MKDVFLIRRRVSERSLVFHFGRYLISNISLDDDFSKFDVDVKYNNPSSSVLLLAKQIIS